MKKKLLFALFSVFLITLALCTTVFAARVSDCPFTFKTNYTWDADVTVTEFDIYDVENMYNKTGKYENRLHYTYKASDFLSLSLICYDAYGMPIQTLDFNQYMGYIDVPDTTAIVELIPNNPGYGTDTFFHCKYINAYSSDGRAIGITELQVPVYKMVGWYPEVTVYADDGRTMAISPFQVEAYRNVGWYPAEEALYRLIQQLYHEYKAAADYKSIIDLVDEYIGIYEGTNYASSLYAIRTEAMDLWRKSSNSPLPSFDYSISENSIGTPEVTIHFTNVSYKTIVAFKAKFTCYNIFGNVENSYYDTFYCDDANMAPAESWNFTWTLYGADSVHTLKNIRVTEVVFSDGTKWYR